MSEHDDAHDVDADVQALLEAGARDVPDYDVKRGLALHLGALAMPIAAATASATATTAASTAATPAALAPTALSAKGWLAWMAVPIAGVSVAAALWWNHAFSADVTPGPERGTPSASSRTQPKALPASAPPADAPRAEVATSNTGETVATPRGAVADTVVRPGGAESRIVAARAARSTRVGSGKGDRLVLAETDERTPTSSAGTGDSSRSAMAASAIASAARPSVDDAAERTKSEDLRKEQAAVAQTAESDLVRLEMESLMQAKRALSSDPARALSIARDGERQFAKGVLREERQHVLILALIQLGRLDEARRVAAPYIASHPDSPFAKRVQKSLDAAMTQRSR